MAQGLPERINADAVGPETGLARLVLTLIEVLRKVLEHQAVRRMAGGRLSGEEVEWLGLALAKLDDRMGELKRVFGLSDEDLDIGLGPLGRLKRGYYLPELASPSRSTGLVEILDGVLEKGLVIAGDIKINLANVELLTSQTPPAVVASDLNDRLDRIERQLEKLSSSE